MKSKALFVGVLCLLGYAAASSGQGGAQAPPPPPTDTVATDIPGVVAGGTKIRVFRINESGGSEGPVPVPDGGVVFTERPSSRIWRIGPDDKVSLFLENTSGALGLAVDPKGRLIGGLTAPVGKARVAVLWPKGQEAVLATTCDGKPMNRPNDLVAAKNGAIYYSDPGPTEAELKDGYPKADGIVCYIAPGSGKAIQVAGPIRRPNGVLLSPDEKTLYVNESYGEYILAFDVQPDGTLRNRRNFGKYQIPPTLKTGPTVQVADGLAVDNAGRVYTVTSFIPWVQVFSPQGQSLGTIPLSRGAQNLTFAGPDKKTLYVTGGGFAYKIPMIAQGILSRPK
jgi:gluconolactonase